MSEACRMAMQGSTRKPVQESAQKSAREPAQEPARDQEPVSITAVNISRDRVLLDVQLSPITPRNTTPCIASLALEAFPNLGAHACINSQGPTFASVIEKTSIPHLLEHLIIDIQVADPGSSDTATFKGITKWMDEAAGIARVEVSLQDDIIAMRAVNAALSFLNKILSSDKIA